LQFEHIGRALRAWEGRVTSLCRSTRCFIAATVVVVALLGTPATADAVPAFARKYQTSCQTCHAMFPKLNAFGEAFRLRGYRMPAQTEDMVKEKPVSLGAPAYKRLWPEAIWPGEISSSVPLAVNVKLADVNTSSVNEDGTVTSVRNDFMFPQEVNIFGAGTLGDHVSYLAEVTFAENPDSSVSVELEHAHMGFDSPFGPEDLFHFRIGKFAPNIVDGFQEMWLSTDAGIDSMFAYNPAASKATASSSIVRCGSPASPTASDRARPTRAGVSTATTRKTSTRGSTTRSAGWGSTATPVASRCPTRTGATTRCASASSRTAATATASTSQWRRRTAST
jgi:hypothetical protein